jgi:hypothetical protein
MSTLARSLTVLTVLAMAVTSAQGAPTEEEIAKAVRQLGDNNFAVREKATANLLEAGWAAKPALRQALRSDDPEIRRRAADIFEKVKRQIPSGLPKDIADLLRKYHDPERKEREEELLSLLLAKGGIGYLVAVELIDDMEDAESRSWWEKGIVKGAPRYAAHLLAEGKEAEAEKLLERALANIEKYHEKDSWRDEPLVAAKNYAAFLILRGTVKDQLPQLQARAEKGDKPALRTLAYLYRAQGDWVKARQAAEKAGLMSLLEQMLLEQPDWEAFASQPPSKEEAKERSSLVRHFARKAAALRLAGKDEDFQKALAEVRKNAIPNLDEDKLSLPWRAGAALLLNDVPPADVLPLLDKHNDVIRPFEILCAQLKFREAFALADSKPLPPDRKLSWLDLSRSRALMRLGETKKAAALMDKVFEGLKGTPDPRRYWYFLESEHRMGLHERAFDHCLRVFVLNKAGQIGEGARSGWGLPGNDWLAEGALTGGGSGHIDMWWRLLSKIEPEQVRLETIRDLFAGKIQGKELLEVMRKADEAAPSLREIAEHVVLAQVRACLAAGRRDLARTRLEKWFQKPTNPDNLEEAPYTGEPFLLLADLCAADKDWPEAARWYRRAWEGGTGPLAPAARNPWPFYLHGRALIQAGQEKEGRRCMELAPWLALGDEELRFHFAQQLARTGQREAALREYELALKVGDGGDLYEATEALVYLARAATIKGDFRAAAQYHERVRFSNLHWNLGQVRTGIYLVLSHRVHHQQARAALAAGRTEDARKEIRLC